MTPPEQTITPVQVDADRCALVDDLTRWGHRLWRTEPATSGAERTRVLLELHGLRCDLEDLGRRLAGREPSPADLRRLDDCAQRLAGLARYWA